MTSGRGSPQPDHLISLCCSSIFASYFRRPLMVVGSWVGLLQPCPPCWPPAWTSKGNQFLLDCVWLIHPRFSGYLFFFSTFSFDFIFLEKSKSFAKQLKQSSFFFFKQLKSMHYHLMLTLAVLSQLILLPRPSKRNGCGWEQSQVNFTKALTTLL